MLTGNNPGYVCGVKVVWSRVGPWIVPCWKPGSVPGFWCKRGITVQVATGCNTVIRWSVTMKVSIEWQQAVRNWWNRIALLGSLGPPTLTFSVPGPCLECSGLVTYALCVRSVALTLDYFQIHLEISFNPFRFLLLCEDEICRSNMGLFFKPAVDTRLFSTMQYFIRFLF